MHACSRAFYQYEFLWQNMSGVAVYWEKCVKWIEAASVAWRASRVVLVIASCKGRACAGLLQSGLSLTVCGCRDAGACLVAIYSACATYPGVMVAPLGVGARSKQMRQVAAPAWYSANAGGGGKGAGR